MVVRVFFVALAAVAVVAASPDEAEAGSQPGHDVCGIPTTKPVWVDYSEGSVTPEFRAPFAQQGVVVTASGTAIPKYFRDNAFDTSGNESSPSTEVFEKGGER